MFYLVFITVRFWAYSVFATPNRPLTELRPIGSKRDLVLGGGLRASLSVVFFAISGSGLAAGDAGPVASGICPTAPDYSVPLDHLIHQIQRSSNEAEAHVLSSQMWELWAKAPDDRAQAILDRGMSRRASFDFLGALDDFDRLIAYCPSYAEGYNQRAFVNYLRQDYAAALLDLDRAVALSPRHVAALSGRALSLFGLKKMAEARVALGVALSLNPWLPERYLAFHGGPLSPDANPPASSEEQEL